MSEQGILAAIAASKSRKLAESAAEKAGSRFNEEFSDVDEAGMPKKKTAAELAKRRKYMKILRTRGPKNRALSAKLKRAFAKVPSSVLAKRSMKGKKTRKRLYGESLAEVKNILSGLTEGSAITGVQYKTLQDSLMGHLLQIVSEDVDSDAIYQVILHDIAPVMQVVEAVMERDTQVVESRDASVFGAYLSYLDGIEEAVAAEGDDEDEWEDEVEEEEE